MHHNAKRCRIIVAKHRAEHGRQKRPKCNVGEPILSYGIELCSFSQNPCVDDIVFSNQTLYVRLRPHRQKIGNGPPPSSRNMMVKLLALRLSAIDL